MGDGRGDSTPPTTRCTHGSRGSCRRSPGDKARTGGERPAQPPLVPAPEPGPGGPLTPRRVWGCRSPGPLLGIWGPRPRESPAGRPARSRLSANGVAWTPMGLRAPRGPAAVSSGPRGSEKQQQWGPRLLPPREPSLEGPGTRDQRAGGSGGEDGGMRVGSVSGPRAWGAGTLLAASRRRPPGPLRFGAAARSEHLCRTTKRGVPRHGTAGPSPGRVCTPPAVRSACAAHRAKPPAGRGRASDA